VTGEVGEIGAVGAFGAFGAGTGTGYGRHRGPAPPSSNLGPGGSAVTTPACDDRGMTSLSDFAATTLTGEDRHLSDYAGRVVLVVNTASACGFTPQYAGLEALYQELEDEGLVVLGFPCNQFGSQESGTEEEIGEFCQVNYGVTFPMFAKVDVNGDGAHPLFTWLKAEKKGLLGGKIKWNFTKFLVGRDGQVVKRYAPTTEPKDIADDIRAALAAAAA